MNIYIIYIFFFFLGLAQSGDDDVLERMRRGYNVETYLQLVNAIREKIPNITFTSDFIAGFCGEGEDAHQRTLELIEKVKYSFIFFFPYSVRDVSIKKKKHIHIMITIQIDDYKFDHRYFFF